MDTLAFLQEEDQNDSLSSLCLNYILLDQPELAKGSFFFFPLGWINSNWGFCQYDTKHLTRRWHTFMPIISSFILKKELFF